MININDADIGIFIVGTIICPVSFMAMGIGTYWAYTYYYPDIGWYEYGTDPSGVYFVLAVLWFVLEASMISLVIRHRHGNIGDDF